MIVQELEVVEERLNPRGTARIMKLTVTLLHVGAPFGGWL